MNNCQFSIHKKNDDVDDMPKRGLNLAVSLPTEYPSYVTGDTIGQHEAFERKFVNDEPLLRPDHFRRVITDSLGLYEFTTENILEYLPDLDVQGKRCLTVASSGDHIINLLTAGASEVVSFDSVKAAGEITWLKMQALADMEWAGPKDFRANLWNKVLERIPFARLCDRANAPSFGTHQSVVKQVFENLPAEHLFLPYQTTGRNAYIATDEAFEKAKDACRQALSDGRVSFINADVRELPLIDQGQFDVIVLSNILQSRWERMISPYTISRDADDTVTRDRLFFSQERLKGLVGSMIWPVANLLTPQGVMMASYTYACRDEADDYEEEKYCTEHGIEYCPNPIRSKPLRVAAFSPPPGFNVLERGWETINSSSSGQDVGVFVRRD
jgi:hypothetical protein